MAQFLQATIQGLSLAAIYALIAIGFVVIYKSTQVLSFAQPALVLTGAYFVSYFAFTLGWSFWLGFLQYFPAYFALVFVWLGRKTKSRK